MQATNYMPPTTDADFLQVLDCCDPMSTGREGWETLMSWAPGQGVMDWLNGFRSAREAMAGCTYGAIQPTAVMKR